jgi:hypothetical protein
LTREEVEGAGYEYGELKQMTQMYDPAKLEQGWNRVAGEDVFFYRKSRIGLVGLSGSILTKACSTQRNRSPD